MSFTDFLPPDYTPPKEGGQYMRLQDGENRFRILSSPIMGYEAWVEESDGSKKPVRYKMDEEPVNGMHEKKAKHFWALVVLDYADGATKILTITQKTIIDAITSLARNTKWGNPREYDIVIHRKGKELNTEYSVMPEPKESIDQNIFDEAEKINLQALFTNDDPFANSNAK